MKPPFHQTPQPGRSTFHTTGSHGAQYGGGGGGGAQTGMTPSMSPRCPGGGR